MRSDRAKVLFEVGGAPMVSYPVQAVQKLGAHPVVVVVGYQKEAVEQAVSERFQGVQFALQSEQKGTGHAAQMALPHLEDFEGTVLLLYGDVPLLTSKTLEALNQELIPGDITVALISTELENPTGYGRVLRDEAGNVTRIVEHKDASSAERLVTEVNAGIYAVEASFLRKALGQLSSNNAQGEYYLTDIVDLAMQANFRVAALSVDPEEVQGANDRAQLAELEHTANRRTLAHHLAQGVSILDPSTTFIAPTVAIEADAVIYPGVHLRGKTSVGARTTVDTGCILINSVVGPDVQLKPYSILESATVEAGCIVGPFARLRPKAQLKEGARVGNFVEVKNAVLAEDAKANHLAYIGDASVGPGANLGAGTITCNYDGVGKHNTTIGKGVFVGSNSTLVAPLSLGDGSYVGAGSVVTEDVPPGALALGRSRQVNKPDRAAMIRAAAEALKAGTK